MWNGKLCLICDASSERRIFVNTCMQTASLRAAPLSTASSMLVQSYTVHMRTKVLFLLTRRIWRIAHLSCIKDNTVNNIFHLHIFISSNRFCRITDGKKWHSMESRWIWNVCGDVFWSIKQNEITHDEGTICSRFKSFCCIETHSFSNIVSSLSLMRLIKRSVMIIIMIIIIM